LRDESLFLKREIDGDALISSDRQFQALVFLTHQVEEILVAWTS